jgi:putative iron-regulated protein
MTLLKAWRGTGHLLISLALLGAGCRAQTRNAAPSPGPVVPVAPEDAGAAQVRSYAEVVHRSYLAALSDARAMHDAVLAFVADPQPARHEAAKNAWRRARASYGETEAFRYYEGPIDFADPARAAEGPEGRLNAWPLNEAFIDYVAGDPGAGIIQNPTIPIRADALIERNAAEDEANVTTGYHAVEFLLWGQDLSPQGSGNRPASDYAPGDPIRARRGQYLTTVSALIVADLEGLVAAWAPGRNNYRSEFEALPPRRALGKLLTGLATLSGFELASERLAVGLDSGNQEHEQSCFSDTTTDDFRANIRGISHVYRGRHGDYRGRGLDELVRAAAPALDARIATLIDRALEQSNGLDAPFDRTLASPKGSPQRARAEALVATLQELAEALKSLSGPLGVEVVVLAK